MGRSEVLQGLRLMKFEAVLERWHKRALSQAGGGGDPGDE